MTKMLTLFSIFIVSALLLSQGGCKKGDEFSIVGVWEVNEALTYDNGDTLNRTTRYLFSGSEVEGNVSLIAENPGVFSGSYLVEGIKITFTYDYGRGPAWYLRTYTGIIYREADSMQGTVEGAYSLANQIQSSWTGTFFAVKE